MEGNTLITNDALKPFYFKFTFRQTIEGTVLGEDMAHAENLLRNEFGEAAPEFTIIELSEQEIPAVIIDADEDDPQLTLPHIVN